MEESNISIVFIDTNILRGNGFIVLNEFFEFLNKNKINIYISKVACNEFFSFARDHQLAPIITAQQAVESYKKQWKKNGLITNKLDFDENALICHFPDLQALKKNFEVSFKDYLKKFSINIINIEGDHANQVDENYHNWEGLFQDDGGNRTDDKTRAARKEHYPDAYILEAALDLKKRYNTTIYCITRDARLGRILEENGLKVFVDIKEVMNVIDPPSNYSSTLGESKSDSSKTLTESLDLISQKNRELRIKILGYTQWFFPIQKEQLFSLLEEKGYSVESIQSNAQLLIIPGLLKGTENYYLPIKEKIGEEAVNVVFEEILELINKEKNMDKSLKQNALKQFVKMNEEKVRLVLDKEVEKIKSLLKELNQYNLIEDQLDLLKIICQRFPKKAIGIIKDFLKHIDQIELTYQPDYLTSQVELEKIYNKPSLIVKALEILECVGYIQVEESLKILLEYSLYPNENVTRQAHSSSIALAVCHVDSKKNEIDFTAQEKIIKGFKALSKSEQQKYLLVIINLANYILSLKKQTVYDDSNSFTITKEPIPFSEQLKTIRKDTIYFLQDIYNFIESENEKLQILSTFKMATQFPNFKEGNEKLLEIIIQNARTVINFYIGIIPNESYKIRRSVEKKAVKLYHNLNAIFADIKDEVFKENIRDLTEKIEQFQDILNGDAEFVIYKTLIGYDSVLPHSWKNREWLYPSMEQKEQYISDKLQDYVDSINENSYELWQQRILCGMQTKSSDGADFLHLIEFLKVIGKQKPQFLLFLIEKHTDSLPNFLVIILDNLLLNQETKENTYLLMRKWIEEDQYLIECARVFSSGNKELDLSLLKLLFDKALTFQDIPTLIQILVVVVVNYKERDKWLLKEIFLPCLQELTKVKNTVWMKELWYLKEWATLVSDLDKQGIEFLLNNLLHVENIESHAEEILMPIAFKMPETVLELFKKRIALNKTNERSLSYTYNLLPYEFYILKEPLSKNAEQTVDIVSSWYDEQSENFEHQGARLLSIIFSDYSKPFETKLLALIQSGADKNLNIVISILKNYQGEDFLYETCKALIKVLSPKDKRISDIRAILIRTGVVKGEHGLEEAYEDKIREIKKWLEDENDNIKKFASFFIEYLKNASNSAKRHTTEYLELRNSMNSFS